MPTPIAPAAARPCRSAAAPPPSWCPVSSPAGGRPTGRAATRSAHRFRGRGSSRTPCDMHATASPCRRASAASPRALTHSLPPALRPKSGARSGPSTTLIGSLTVASSRPTSPLRWPRCPEGGDEEFYRGDLARRIVAGAHAVGSPLTLGDLAEHRADWVEPLRVRYRDGEATSFPPPTQGFAALAILALLDGFDVANLDDADYVHVIVEATKLAFEDRDRYLADPTMVTVPVERCLDAARLARRRSRISRRAAMAVGGPPADGDTIAIVTADAQGNAVSVIQSTYHEFGAAVVAGGTGVLLQNRGAFFSLDPGHPNALAPRKRTAHTLIPSIYMVGGRPRFVYGTMGGEGQPQTQAALVTRLVDRGLGPQAAVEAPRWLYGRTWARHRRRCA